MATDVSVREAHEDDLEILINNNKALAEEYLSTGTKYYEAALETIKTST